MTQHEREDIRRRQRPTSFESDYLVFVDETGSRKIEEGAIDAIGLLVVPNSASVVEEMSRFVSEVTGAAS